MPGHLLPTWLKNRKSNHRKITKQNFKIDKKSNNGRNSFRRNTTHDVNTQDDTQQENKIGYNGKSKSISSLQEPSPTVAESDVNTPDQQSNLKDNYNNNKFITSPQEPGTTFIETNVNTLHYSFIKERNACRETSPTMSTDIQTPISFNSLNDSLKFT